MPRRVSEVGEGTDASNGVYGFIRELLVEGKDGRLVNRRGRYRLNWPRALDRYADYKARKKPHFKSKNHTGRKASNSLRSALLNFYKKEGAKEYKESQRVNDNGEIVKREFQMPLRVFESLFGNTVPSSGESGLSEQEDEQEMDSITSEDEIDAQSTPNSSDHGFDETMDQSCVDFQSTHNSSAHGFDETIDQSCVVAEDICPASGPVKGGYTFHISFPEPLSEDVSSGMAEFHGVATVQVHKLNPFTLSGSVPPSDQSGDVSVTVTTQSGQHLCTTRFQYVDQMREVAQQLVHDPAKRRSWFEMLLEEYGFFGTDSHFVQMLDRLNTEYQGITGAWLETISNDLPVSAEPSSLTSPHELLTSPNVDGVLHVSPDAALHGQTFDTSAVDSVLEDGILDEISEDLDLFGVVEDICPTSGSVKGGYRFYISLTEPLSQDVSSGMAEFEGVATVSVHKLNPFTLSGSVPSSDQPRDVSVRVVTQTGQCLGMTHFQYVDEMHDMARQLIHDPAKQALWFAILLEEYGFFGFDSDLAQVLDPLDMQCQGRSEEKSSDDSSENNSDTDYFADVETSSIDSLGYQTLSRSTSEDNISKLYSKEQMKASTHQSISSIGMGAFARNGVMLKTGQIREGVQRKSFVLILRDSHFDSSLPEVVKGLDYTLAFHLAMSSTSIPRQMHTANESFLALRGSGKAQPTISFCKLHPSLDVLLEGSLVKNNNDHISRAVATKQHCCNQLNEGILAELRTQIPVEKAIAVDWKSSDISVKQSGAHALRELWVFTSAFRPTRKTLFVYFADRRDALPPSYFFEDEDCESQIRCWRWKGSGNNSFKFTETLKAGKLLPGGGKLQMESHADPPVTYIVRDKQAQTQSESGICLSWMHVMMDLCRTPVPTVKASYVRSGCLGPLGTDLMMSSGSRNDDSKKRKLNICQPAVSSGEGNTKINREKCGMVESVFIDQTDCKIKGNEAKETKIQADSSKTETTLSFPSFAMEISKITSVPLTNCKIQQEFVWPACKMSHLELAEGGSCRPYGTAVRDALPFPIREDLTCFPVQEAPILPSGDQPDEPNLVSSLGNAEKPTVHRCSTEEIKQWNQQLTRVIASDVGNDKAGTPPLIISGPTGVGKTLSLVKAIHRMAVSCTFPDDFTHLKIEGNRGNETKVQANSSQTKRIVDAGKSLSAFVVDKSEFARAHDSAMRAFKGSLDDALQPPLGTDLMMSSGSRSDDSNKEKLNICQPVVSSGVGNTKINHETWGMVESLFIDQTDCKIKGNEAKETKVEADSSKSERRTDAGKSLLAFLRYFFTRDLERMDMLRKEDEDQRLRLSAVLKRKRAILELHETEGKGHVSKAKTSKENFAKCTRDASFSGDWTDSTIKVNRGEETKVQADSSNTQRGSPASAFRPLRTDLLMSSGSTHGDSNKGKLNICKPVVASCVGNTKVNCDKYGMVKSVFSDDDTDCKIKGNEAKETKIEADSSKSETTIDAGKSLYPLAIERSEIASDAITSLKSRIERFRLACEMPCLDRLGVLDQSDSSSSDISGIKEGNPCGNMTIGTFDYLPFWSSARIVPVIVEDWSDSSSRRDISRIIEGNPYGNMMESTSGIIERNPYGNMTIGTFGDLPVWSCAETLMAIVIDRSDSSARRDISRFIEGNPFVNMMEGTFDDLLVWPFAGTVTVSVIDRSGSRASSNISRIIQAKPNLLSS